MNSKNTQILAALLMVLGLFYISVQIVFLDYFNSYGFTFGMSDVDNYMIMIRTGQFKWEKPLIYLIGISTPFPDFLMTVLVPFFGCIMLPLSVYIFGFYMSRNNFTAILTLLFFILGTYSLQSFIIWSLWGQYFSLIFFILFVVFFEEFLKRKSSDVGILASLMALISFLFHTKLSLTILVYIVARDFARNHRIRYMVWSITVALLAYNFGFELDYPSSIPILYIFTVFASSLIWVFAGSYIVEFWKSMDKTHRTLVLFSIFMIAASPLFALSRLVLSTLPFVSYFAAMFVKNTKLVPNNTIRYILISAVIILLLMHFIAITNNKMAQMLWEMLPQGKEKESDYRHIDPMPFARMMYGDNAEFRVSGYVYFNNTVETVEFLHNKA